MNEPHWIHESIAQIRDEISDQPMISVVIALGLGAGLGAMSPNGLRRNLTRASTYLGVRLLSRLESWLLQGSQFR